MLYSFTPSDVDDLISCAVEACGGNLKKPSCLLPAAERLLFAGNTLRVIQITGRGETSHEAERGLYTVKNTITSKRETVENITNGLTDLLQTLGGNSTAIHEMEMILQHMLQYGIVVGSCSEDNTLGCVLSTMLLNYRYHFKQKYDTSPPHLTLMSYELQGVPTDVVDSFIDMREGSSSIPVSADITTCILTCCDIAETRKQSYTTRNCFARTDIHTLLCQTIDVMQQLATHLGEKNGYGEIITKTCTLFASLGDAMEFLHGIAIDLQSTLKSVFEEMFLYRPECVALSSNGRLRPWDLLYLRSVYRHRVERLEEEISHHDLFSKLGSYASKFMGLHLDTTDDDSESIVLTVRNIYNGDSVNGCDQLGGNRNLVILYTTSKDDSRNNQITVQHSICDINTVYVIVKGVANSVPQQDRKLIIRSIANALWWFRVSAERKTAGLSVVGLLVEKSDYASIVPELCVICWCRSQDKSVLYDEVLDTALHLAISMSVLRLSTVEIGEKIKNGAAELKLGNILTGIFQDVLPKVEWPLLPLSEIVAEFLLSPSLLLNSIHSQILAFDLLAHCDEEDIPIVDIINALAVPPSSHPSAVLTELLCRPPCHDAFIRYLSGRDQ